MNEEIAFWILSAIALLGALVAVRKRNLIHGVFALLVFFAGLSGLFLLLLAEFIAAVQVLVYIGAVGVLLLFAIMLTERVAGDDDRRMTSRGWFWGLVVALAVFVVLLLPAITSPQNQQLSSPEAAQTIKPSVEELGKKLMDPYVVTLEVLALLLTAALIGAVTAAQGVRMPKEEDSPE
jgi:NADH-quinone oxidoreductase subunit J